jgi:hypothetical protein
MSDDDDTQSPEVPQADPNRLAEDMRQRLADDDARWQRRAQRIRDLNLFVDLTHNKSNKVPARHKRLSTQRPGDDPLIQSLLQHADRYRKLNADRERWMSLIEEKANGMPHVDKYNMDTKIEILRSIMEIETQATRHAEAIDRVLDKLDLKETAFYKSRAAAVIKATEQAMKVTMHRERLKAAKEAKKKPITDVPMEELLRLVGGDT